MSRENNAKIAQETVQIFSKGFYTFNGSKVDISHEIKSSIDNTKLYTPDEGKKLLLDNSHNFPEFETKFSLINGTSDQAAIKLLDSNPGKVSVLNFASAKNPGGGFLKGSMAQEESLALISSLYPSLKSQKKFYDYHWENRTPIYSDHIIFSPDVVFFRDKNLNLLENHYKISIVTSPAVNLGQIQKNKEKISKKEIDDIMIKRIEKILYISLINKTENIVLGAFGCGVFKNNPSDVARYFETVLLKNPIFKNKFKQVSFAVLDKTPNKLNYRAFEAKFKKYLS